MQLERHQRGGREMIAAIIFSLSAVVAVVVLAEASGEQSLLTFMLLFALSYQNGFFWERVLKPAAER
jgi:hypothetical protein